MNLERIEDIADRTGLPPAVVDRILHRQPAEVGTETAERVRITAEHLGWHEQPPAAAGTTTALMLTSAIEDHSSLPPGLLNGLISGLQQEGMHLGIARLDEQPRPQALEQLMASCHAQALIINYHYGIPRPLLEFVHHSPLPAVWINSRQESGCIGPDDIGAASELTRHLIALGHRRIAYCDLDSDFTRHDIHVSCLDRLAGYEQAMAEAGLAPQVLGCERPPPLKQRVAAAVAMLGRADRPTAIIAYNSHTAMPLFLAATGQLGLHVPRDLSLAQFCSEEPDEAGAGLTAMAIPWRQLGFMAARMLGQRLADPDLRHQPNLVSLRLLRGNSCAPPSVG
jgi:DNA-binding LacI/PurR family transcriptional regulator